MDRYRFQPALQKPLARSATQASSSTQNSTSIESVSYASISHPLYGLNRQPLHQLPASAFMHNKQQQQQQQQQLQQQKQLQQQQQQQQQQQHYLNKNTSSTHQPPHQPQQTIHPSRQISTSQTTKTPLHYQQQQSSSQLPSSAASLASRREQPFSNMPRSVGPYTSLSSTSQTPSLTISSQSSSQQLTQKPQQQSQQSQQSQQRSLVQLLPFRNQKDLESYYNENENYTNTYDENTKYNNSNEQQSSKLKATSNSSSHSNNNSSSLISAPKLASSYSAPVQSAAQEVAMRLSATLANRGNNNYNHAITPRASSMINNNPTNSAGTTNSSQNSNSNSIKSLLTTSQDLQKQLFMPKFTSESSLASSAGISGTQSVFNFLSNPGVSSKSSQEILQELELKQFRTQRAQEKAKLAIQNSKELQQQQLADNIKLISNRFPIDNITSTTASNLIRSKSANDHHNSRASSNNTRSDSESEDDLDFSEEAIKKQRKLNEEHQKRIQLNKSLKGVKEYYEQIGGDRMKKMKILAKEEEKTARVRQELIEAAQAQERERAEAERRSQREKLVQIKRAEELRKRKRVIAAAAAAVNSVVAPVQPATQSTLEYRNRMIEELKNMNLDEKLNANSIDVISSSSSHVSANSVTSIAPNLKRVLASANAMDFEFLAAGCEEDETTDSANYFALLRFVFSQDFNRTDNLRIENKRIPNKFSNWKEYFSIFEYLFLMECVANIQQNFVQFKSNENYRQPLGCYVKPVSQKENAHGFLELQVCRRGADLDESEYTAAMEDDYYTLMAMRNHAVLISSTSDMDLSTLSTKVRSSKDAFLFFGWVVPPDKSDPKSVLKVYVDIETRSFQKIFQDNPLLYVTIFNFTKMTTFIREYLAIKNMRECGLNRFIYNPNHIVETKTPISNPQVLVPLFDELHSKYNESQFQSIKEICLTSQGICMLQGPPGTGKTHTLLGLLSGLYLYIKKNPDTTKPKIMICAPSNTAVDEIVSRIVEHGLHQPGGLRQRINVVRMGAIDYVPQENVKRASLEYQIETAMRQKGIQSTSSKGQAIEQETLIDMRINVARVNQDIEKAKKELVGSELKELLNTLYAKRRALKSKIAVQKLEKVARRDQIKLISDQILGLADVVCCTLSSSMSEKLERFKNQIEVLIVDEAAQCSEPNNIIPLFYQPNKMVLIGDPKQLPATTFQPDSNVTKYNRSLFERIIDNSINPYFLDQQYRMHPDIRAFPSKAFYDNKLKDGQLVLSREFPASVAKMEKHNVQFIDITFSREKFSNKSYENDAEAEGAISICNAVFAQIQANNITESPSIGIITPYKQQTKIINDMIRRNVDKSFWKHIQVNTVDSFQGQEKDIIIFTTVRATHSKDRFRQRMIGFLQDERRMNVALTRARYCLFVLGHADTLNSNPTWGSYVDSMAANKRYGKLTRKEHLRDIGEYVIQGTLIDTEKSSSNYVKKDWGEEYRLAQLQNEQVNELKLDDFETEAAAITTTANEGDSIPVPTDNSTDLQLDNNNNNNHEINNSTAGIDCGTTPMDVEEIQAVSAATTVAKSTEEKDLENENDNEENNDYDDDENENDCDPNEHDENGGDATPPNRHSPQRTGITMQEAMEREEEENAMREFGSGLQGLKFLLNPAMKPRGGATGGSTKSVRFADLACAQSNNSNERGSDNNAFAGNGDDEEQEATNVSMEIEEEFSKNLIDINNNNNNNDSNIDEEMRNLQNILTDQYPSVSTASTASSGCANPANPQSPTILSSNSTTNHKNAPFSQSSSSAFRLSSAAAIAKSTINQQVAEKEKQQQQQQQQPQQPQEEEEESSQPISKKQLLMKIIFASEEDRLKAQITNGFEPNVDIYDQMRQQKLQNIQAKKAQAISALSKNNHLHSNSNHSKSTSTNSSRSIQLQKIDPIKLKTTNSSSSNNNNTSHSLAPLGTLADHLSKNETKSKQSSNSVYDAMNKQRSASLSATTTSTTTSSVSQNSLTTTITSKSQSSGFAHPTTCVTTIHSSASNSRPATTSATSASSSSSSSNYNNRNGLVEVPSSYILKPASSLTKPLTGIMCASPLLHPQMQQRQQQINQQQKEQVIQKSSSSQLLGSLFMKK